MQVRFIVLFGLLVTLSACDKAKEVLGLTRETPDEFQAVNHPPLEIPPEFTLRPPQPGATRPQETMQIKQLEKRLFQKTAPEDIPAPMFKSGTPQPRTKATRQVLYEAGVSQRQPDIKEVINREAYEAEMDTSSEKPSTFMQSLSSWEKKKDNQQQTA